jgi:hypothetical protein
VLVKNGYVDTVLLNTYADLGRAGAAYASATAENTGSRVGAVCGDAEQRGGRYMDGDACVGGGERDGGRGGDFCRTEYQ